MDSYVFELINHGSFYGVFIIGAVTLIVAVADKLRNHDVSPPETITKMSHVITPKQICIPGGTVKPEVKKEKKREKNKSEFTFHSPNETSQVYGKNKR